MIGKVRVADYIASRAVAAGARHVFLVTGGGAMHLNDAFNRNRELTTICFHHEQAAAIAAEGYFRVNNRLVLLNVTTGPGAINALNGVFGAYVDSQAMLIFSGQVKRETMLRNQPLPLRQLGDQEVDIVSMINTAVKYAAVLQDPLEVRAMLDKAIFLATDGRPGPIWIDVPVDVQGALVEPESLIGWVPQDIQRLLEDPRVTPNTRYALSYRQEHTIDAKLDELLCKLRGAHRPVLMAGTGVRSAGMQEFFPVLAEKLGIPVVTGWNAHDTIERNHSCYAGKPGTVGDRAGNFTVQNADLLIVLGCRLNIRQISYNWKSFAPRATKVMVDADPTEIAKHTLDIDSMIYSNLRDFIPRFLARLDGYSPSERHSEYLKWCRERVDRYPVAPAMLSPNDRALNPYTFIKKLFSYLNESSVVVAGNGSACVIGFQACEIKQGQRFFSNSGCASMGYDLPAAIGACLANDSKPVICLAGDGSLMMNLQELQTVVGYKLPVKILVLNNNGYASIRQTQNAYFPDNVFGTDPGNGVTFPDFVNLARVFGIPSARVQCIEDWESESIQVLIETDGPALIDVFVDTTVGFSPKLASRKCEDGSMVSPALEDMAPFLSRDELRENMIS